MSIIVLVRHAEIDLPRRPGDTDPPLNDQGLVRARALAECLALAGVRRIYTFGLRRSAETVAPLAQRAGVAPQAMADTETLVRALRDPAAQGTACIAGHTNTLPEIMAALGADAGDVRIAEDDFANLFVLSGVGAPGSEILRLRYGAA